MPEERRGGPAAARAEVAPRPPWRAPPRVPGRAAVWISGWILGASLLAAQPRPALAVRDPGCQLDVVVQRSGTTLYPLSRAFLKAGGDSAWTATRRLAPGFDYTLDRTRGILRLLREPVPGETLRVWLCGLVAPPPLELQLLEYRPAPDAADSAADAGGSPRPVAARPMTRRIPAVTPEGATLTLSGNKTVAVEVGSNQDAFLRQSLDLALSGALAPGVEITGAISDRNTPLTAAGATQELQAIDRLLIELKAPQGGAALGDLPLRIDGGEFSRLERRLQGVRGEWRGQGLQGLFAAASASGEFHSVQRFGVEGRQGPYVLTDRTGAAGITVVPGSETVTLDGERLTRGEGADYSIDYERAQLTFSNRRPVSSVSRISVDYQIAVNRYRRDFAAGSARWERGVWRASTTLLAEGDDRGRPLAVTLDAGDQLALAAAGDSSGAALGSGVRGGGGDYRLVTGTTGPFYAFAGLDSGEYAVSFARVGEGRGEYLDSAVVAGRTIYRHVGPGLGTHRVGRLLPLPESHRLWSLSGGMDLGPASLDVEGAVSGHDRNTLSGLDDRDNLGRAGRLRFLLAGRAPWLGGSGGLRAEARSVGRTFHPFARLEEPFVEEDWGLPPGTDLGRQTRTELSGYLRPRLGGEVRGVVGRIETPSGFSAARWGMRWERDGRVATRAHWERAAGRQEGVAFQEGGRERRGAELRVGLGWVEPAVRGEWDERRSPSDTGRVAAREREVGGELRTAASLRWQARAGFAVRRSAVSGAGGFEDRSEARTVRATLGTPEDGAWGGMVSVQRRVLRPVWGPGRTTSDLATVRLRVTDTDRGLAAVLGTEVTSEGESERSRRLARVGPGQGAYDSLGAFVGIGRGDHQLIVTVGGELQRVARAATSLRFTFQPAGAGAWQGSRAELSLESEARRRGEIRVADGLLGPGAAREDDGLARGVVTQRAEAEVAPGSPRAGFRLRAERRILADRGFLDFAQVQEERSTALRWRAHGATGWTGEVEGRLRRQDSEQRSTGSPAERRGAREVGALVRVGYSPDSRLQAAIQSDHGWVRPQGSATPSAWSRAWRVGPDLGVSVAGGGRLDLSARRALLLGPSTGLLPIGADPFAPDPFGRVRWESTARFDYRVKPNTTLGLTLTSREREGRASEHEGRAEMRAFF